MGIMRCLAVMVSAVAISALAVSTASAAAITEPVEWYTGTTQAGVTTLGADKAITMQVSEHAVIGNKFQFNTTIAGTNVTLTATGLECISCVITNMEVTEEPNKVAVGAGTLKFTGVTVANPSPCTVSDQSGVAGQLVTKPLGFHFDWMHEGKWYPHFFPKSGTTFMTFSLAGTGCAAIAGTYNVSGTVYGEAVNKTNVFGTNLLIRFSQLIQTTLGGELKVGANRFEMTGTANTKAGGAFFGVK